MKKRFPALLLVVLMLCMAVLSAVVSCPCRRDRGGGDLPVAGRPRVYDAVARGRRRPPESRRPGD